MPKIIGRTYDAADIAKVRKLAARGYTSSQLGMAMGTSRNAMIGLCRRRGIKLLGGSVNAPRLEYPYHKPKSEPKPEPKETSVIKIPPFGKKFKTPPVVPVREIKPVISDGFVLLLDTREHQCRWLIETDKPFKCCGQKIVLGSYCVDHARICYQPPKAVNVGGIA